MPLKTNSGFCPDCGPATVNHHHAWWSAFIDSLFIPLGGIFQWTNRNLSQVLLLLKPARFGLPFFKFLTWCRLGQLTTTLDDHDSLRTRALWESADKLGVKLYQFRILNYPDAALMIANYGSNWRVFDSLPNPDLLPSPSSHWLDDKGQLRRYLTAAKIPMAAGGVFSDLTKAQEIFKRLRKPVITKPHLGSRSRHTTLDINSESELIAGFQKAKQLSPWVIVEEELKGAVIRGTVISGHLVGVVRRDQPSITGDGSHAVVYLIEQENQNPQRRGPIFHPIPIGEDLAQELKLQNLTMETVPSKGQVVRLHPKMSRAFGASPTELTAQIHPDNVVLFEKVAAVLAEALVGIDLIIEDITRSWQTQSQCGVIECNGAPFIDLHHYPLFGPPNPVADYLWKKVFPELAGAAGDSLTSQEPIQAKKTSLRSSSPRSKK